MADTQTKILSLVFVIALVFVSLSFVINFLESSEKQYSYLEGRNIMVKFVEDGVFITTVVDLEFENLRIYMKRQSGEESYYTFDNGSFKKLTRVDYQYPYKDVELVIIEYFEEYHKEGKKWVPYYLRDYSFEGG